MPLSGERSRTLVPARSRTLTKLCRNAQPKDEATLLTFADVFSHLREEKPWPLRRSGSSHISIPVRQELKVEPTLDAHAHGG